MRIIVSALLSLSLIAGLAGFAAAPAEAAKAYSAKKKKHAHYRAYRSSGRSYGTPVYYERWADRLPYGSTAWWQQMDREQRGGRR